MIGNRTIFLGLNRAFECLYRLQDPVVEAWRPSGRDKDFAAKAGREATT